PGAGSLPQFGVNTPLPHSAPNGATSPFYKNPYVIAPNAYPGAPGIIGPNSFAGVNGFPQTGTQYKGGGDYFFFNFAAFTPALPPADRQSYYGSFVRDLCDLELGSRFPLFPQRGAGLVHWRSQPAWAARRAVGYQPGHGV